MIFNEFYIVQWSIYYVKLSCLKGMNLVSKMPVGQAASQASVPLT